MAYTPVNIGNNAGTRGVPTDMDLALKLFSGNVLTSFDRKNMALETVTTQSIGNGKSYQFPVIARSLDNGDTILTHTPGTELSVQDIPVKERIINVDTLKYYSLVINKFEDKIMHFETRAELAKQSGEALANQIDTSVFDTILTATQTSGTIGGKVMQPDGTEVNNDVIDSGSTAEAKGDALLEALYSAQAAMNAKDITGEKIFVTTPSNYNYLVQSNKAIHRDYTAGNGDIAKGTVIEVAGIKIMWSNNLPITTGLASAVDVGGVNKKFQGLIYTPECVGVVKLMDITSEANYLPKELSTLLTSYYSYGMGVLNPGAAAVITGGTQL